MEFQWYQFMMYSTWSDTASHCNQRQQSVPSMLLIANYQCLVYWDDYPQTKSVVTSELTAVQPINSSVGKQTEMFNRK